jgi:hypothetical protein
VALALLGVGTSSADAFGVPFATDTPRPTAVLGSLTTTVGASTISIDPEVPAIPLDGTFRYSARLRLTSPADSVTVRLKVNNPSGKLMIQQTRIENNAATGTVSVSFERDMTDLNLAAGSYPIVFEVRVSQNGRVTEQIIEMNLLLYDSTRPPLPVAFAVRVSGNPLSNPQGRFITDPARSTQARDNVSRIASWVTSDSRARVALSVSPLLLTEWERISKGYGLVTPEGVTEFAEDTQTSKAYAATLVLLRQAINTGRLELMFTGYADPELSALANNDMIHDVDAQYSKGLSATFSSIESSPSTGTLPAGGCLPQAAGTALVRNGVGYAIVSQQCAQVRKVTAPPGLYLTEIPELKVIVADDTLSRATAQGDGLAQIETALDRATATGAQGPLVVSCDVGPGAVDAESVIAAATTLAELPWLTYTLPREIAASDPRVKARLIDGEQEAGAPDGFWREVREARQWARAFTAASGSLDIRATGSNDNSLIAQCSAWADPAGKWELADRGRAYANASLRDAKSVLSQISLRVESITLPGTQGQVPIIITNDGDTQLAVDVSIAADRGIDITGDKAFRVDLSPKDNFVEMNVSITEVLAGDLTVTVSSAGVTLDTQTIRIRASYLDRLAMVGGVVGALAIMLVFIIRRVNSAGSDEKTSSEETE